MDTYYNPEDLAKFGTIGEKAPELAEKFFSYYNAVFEEGALTAREKSLIALAVAHTVQCPYCIDAYTNDCLNKGVTEEQMTEAVHVAAAIRGGASLVHGVQMKNIVKKLEFLKIKIKTFEEIKNMKNESRNIIISSSNDRIYGCRMRIKLQF